MYRKMTIMVVALACLGLLMLVGGCAKKGSEFTDTPPGPPPAPEKEALDLGTALWAAVSRCEPEPVQSLIRTGADINCVHGTLKTTPLIEVVKNGEYWCAADLCTILLKAGADVNKADLQGNTPLHWAARQQCIGQYVDVIKVLLSYGANPKQVNLYSKTPFDLAIEDGCTAKLGILGGVMPKQTGDKPVNLDLK